MDNRPTLEDRLKCSRCEIARRLSNLDITKGEASTLEKMVHFYLIKSGLYILKTDLPIYHKICDFLDIKPRVE